MALPKQVEEAGQRADELLAEQHKAGDTPATDPNPENPDDPPEDNPDNPEPPAEPAPKVVTEDTWEQKYKVLEGKYRKEVLDVRGKQGSFADEIAQLRSEIQRLKDENAQLQKKPEPEPAPDPEPEKPFDISTVLSSQEIEDLSDEGLGPKAMNLISKLVQSIASSTTQSATEPLKESINQTTEASIQERAQNFFDKLVTAVPDWEQINKDQRWHAWLRERVPGTDYTRQAIIKRAEDILDPSNIIKLLNDFKVLYPDDETDTVTDPNPPRKNLDDTVEEVVPDDTTTVQVEPGKIYTKAEVNKFYADQTKGIYRDDPDEAKRIESEILKASLEGRVQ